MLIGYNNDVQYQGKTFHIQTEDRGDSDDRIETQLFQGGQILDTKITSYSDMVEGLEGEERDKRIKSLMQASHKGLYKKLMAGEYNAMVGLEPVELAKDVSVADDFTPSQERVPEAARKVEEEGEAAFVDPAGGSHVDLSQLKSKLASLKEKSGAVESPDVEESPATQVLDASKLSFNEVGMAASKKAVKPDHAQSLANGLKPTGTMAWTGCLQPVGDLAIDGLVEEFINS